jgi:uncharacterized protein (TIGR03905 family)
MGDNIVPIYETTGVCASLIEYRIDQDGLVRDVSFNKGCPGNSKAVARLVDGKPAREIIALLEGLPCGNKATSCPDQLAKALQQHTAADN